MTLQQYNSLSEFPCVFKSIVSYESNDFILDPGEMFIGITKETFGIEDHSIIDIHGHPHHFTGVEFPNHLKEKKELTKRKEKINSITVGEFDSIKYFNN